MTTIKKLRTPRTDATPIFEIFRGNYATDLLAAAVGHFDLFTRLARQAQTLNELRRDLELAERPALVLLTGLRAMGLLTMDREGRLSPTELAREHLVPTNPFNVSEYVALVADSPAVTEFVERLKTNRPAGAKPQEQGAAFIYREGIESAMEDEARARRLTMALAGRARNVAPILAQTVDASKKRILLDIGGGTGLYSIAFLQRYPHLKAIVWDRPEVLKVAVEMAQEYGVTDRLVCRPCDMFRDPVPDEADLMLLSNILHDWDVPECRQLLQRCAAALPRGGQLLIHDVFLNDALDGPLPIALYSCALFSLTEGRAYSAAEYRSWLGDSGLTPGEMALTGIHCGVLPATKS